MIERIIMLVSFFMCAVPFWIISIFNKDSTTPISFWSGGENKLKGKLNNIKGYNHEMALLYRKCAVSFWIAGICSCIHPIIGIIMGGLECTIGVFFVYRNYKKILTEYS